MKIAASGVNFIDVYFRTGLYKAELPATLGSEGAGTVESVGAGVTELVPGDRVAYAMARGSYAENAVVPAAQLVKIPDGVGLRTAAAAMLQGMTAHYLTHSTFVLKPGDTCLVHRPRAEWACCWFRWRGGSARGSSVRSPPKPRRSSRSKPAPMKSSSIRTRISRLKCGVSPMDGASMWCTIRWVRRTFAKSLSSLRTRGMLALFGQSSGPVPPFDPNILNAKGSLFLTRPSLAHHCLTREELLWRAGDVLGWVASGELKIRVDRTYPLAEAAQAHRDLEGRHTAGKLLLIP